MTVSAFQMGEVVRLYNGISKQKPASILDREQEEPQDVVRISAEARKRQILDQTRTEVLAQIRKPR
jgi:hypothetical protein